MYLELVTYHGEGGSDFVPNRAVPGSFSSPQINLSGAGSHSKTETTGILRNRHCIRTCFLDLLTYAQLLFGLLFTNHKNAKAA